MSELVIYAVNFNLNAELEYLWLNKFCPFTIYFYIFNFLFIFLKKIAEIQLIKFIIEAVNNVKPITNPTNVTKIVNISIIPKLSWEPLIKMNVPAAKKIVNIIFESFFIPYLTCNTILLNIII